MFHKYIFSFVCVLYFCLHLSAHADDQFDIVFVRHTDQGGDLFALTLSDLSVRQLTSSALNEEFPAWSRDRAHIAYLGWNDKGSGIYLMNMASGESRLLADDVGAPASWSGDSRSIVTTKEAGESRGLVAVSVSDGSETAIRSGSQGDAYANWSPVRNTLVFESGRDGNPEIYTANIDGTGVRRLTENDILDEWPQWSSDGEFIAFASGVEGNKDLWIMRADGTDKRQLTSGLLFGDAFASWSPDNKSIVLSVQVDESTVSLVLVDVKTGRVDKLVEGTAASWRP
ncbi:MAG: hypothetical protein GY732_01920 [Gammaproteobacteria bacterium]|nr:hypothetical protein [Gammaproteobacteria bacterium]